MIRMTLACLALAHPVAATETIPLAGTTFAARVTGKTIYFEQYGRAYGAETYRGDGSVIWRFFGEDCQEGSWYPEGDAICFVYDYAPTEPQCWHFFDSPDGLVGRVVGADPAEDLLGRRESAAPLICDRPYFGA